jgi:hypothetical protein
MGTKEYWNSIRRWNKYFVPGRLEQPRQNKNLLSQHDKPNEPTEEGPFSFVLFESPFFLVSTVSRGHPSVIYLVNTEELTSLTIEASASNRFALRQSIKTQGCWPAMLPVYQWRFWPVGEKFSCTVPTRPRKAGKYALVTDRLDQPRM